MNRALILWRIAKESMTLIEEALNIRAPQFLKRLNKNDRQQSKVIRKIRTIKRSKKFRLKKKISLSKLKLRNRLVIYPSRRLRERPTN